MSRVIVIASAAVLGAALLASLAYGRTAQPGGSVAKPVQRGPSPQGSPAGMRAYGPGNGAGPRLTASISGTDSIAATAGCNEGSRRCPRPGRSRRRFAFRSAPRQWEWSTQTARSGCLSTIRPLSPG